jgi:gliding motility-associated-like protein
MPAGIQANSGFTNYQWNTGTNTAVANVNNPGWYYISAFNGCATVFDSAYVYLNIPPTAQIVNGDSALLCATDTIKASITNNAIADFFWSNNTQGKCTFPNQNGWLYLNVVNACGNFRDSIYITLKPLPTVNLGPDIFLCPGDSVQIGTNSQAATNYLWSNNAQTSFITVNQQGVFILEAQNECGIVVDSIIISQPLKPFLGNDTLLCSGDTILLAVPNNFNAYLWNGISGSSSFSTTSGGVFIVEAFSGSCSTGDTININLVDLPEIFIEDSIINSLMWFDNSALFSKYINNTGNYSLQAFKSGCMVNDLIYVEINKIKPLDILKNLDSIYCQPSRFVVEIELQAFHQVIWGDGGIENYRIFDVPFADSLRLESLCDTAHYHFKSELVECTCTEMYIPNAITANNDLMNESFKVETNCQIREFRIEIFDRYGALIFTSKNKDFLFNNEICNNCLKTNSLYVYLIQYEALIDSRWKVIDKKGHFINLR